MANPLPFLLNWRDQPLPLDLARAFGRTAPGMIEIGFGNGEFLADLAARHPEANVLGAEIAVFALKQGAYRLAQVKAKHAKLVIGDVRPFLKYALGPGSLQKIYVNYPDPWPKTRHAERRLLRPELLREMARILTPIDASAPVGQLEIATDHDDYAEEITRSLPPGGFKSTHAEPWLPARADYYETKYERKWKAEGKRLHYFIYEPVR
jgi:tRNA (guanine-N7-)-methyltransferase